MTNKPQFVGEMTPLTKLCKPKQWKTIAKSELKQSGYPVYGANGVIGWTDTYNHIDRTILITCRGATCGQVHICCPKSYVTGNAMCLEDLSPAISLDYLARYLMHYDFAANGVIGGSAQPQITKAGLAKVFIRTPPLDSQIQMAAKLDALEKEILNVSAVLSKLDSLVKSRFVEMFGAGDFPRFRLDEVADVQGGLTKNSRREALPMQLPYLRVANVGPTGGVDTSEMLSIGLTGVEARKTLLKADDLLFVEGNGSKDQIGRAAIWDGSIDPCVHQNHLIRARLHDNVLPIFALAFFSSSVGRRQITDKAASTSGLFTLSTGKIKSLELPVPPLFFQQEFAAFVAQIDKSRFAYIWSRTKSVEQALSGPSLTLVIQHIEPQTRSKYRTDVLASPSWPSVGVMLILKTPHVCALILVGLVEAIRARCLPGVM